MSTSGEYICKLSPEDQAYAAANLNETDEVRATKIPEIRQWILENEELHAPTDDFFILRFLRACKFNAEKTKTKLRNYQKQRTNMPEWYSNRDPLLPELQELFDLGVFLPLRQLDNEGRMVVIIRAAVHSPRRHKMSDMLKASLMTLDLALRDHESVTVHGITAILDISGMTYEHLLQLPPSVIKNLVHAWQGCYPVRIYSLDFINAHRFINAVLNIFRSFMNAKLKQRVHTHARGKLKLYENLPISILPEEYGGTGGTIKDLCDRVQMNNDYFNYVRLQRGTIDKNEYWKRAVEKNHEWFAEEEKYRLTPIK